MYVFQYFQYAPAAHLQWNPAKRYPYPYKVARRIVLGALYMLALNATSAYSQQQRGNKTILERKEQFTPRQVITADTTRRVADSTSIGTTTPGEYPFTPEQDRAFYDALQMSIPAAMRFAYDLRRMSPSWLAFMAEVKPFSPEAQMQANINNIPRSMYIPDPREQTAYDYGIAQAFTIPGVYEPFKRGGGIGKGGFQIPLSFFGNLLGLIEDVSPVINYTVDHVAEVEVVVYSIQAIAVTHIFKTQQPEGKYSVTWNLLDDAGRRAPRGDYVGEIRIGNGSIVRKRIRID